MAALFQCLLGPRLIRLFRTDDQYGRNYDANPVERLGDTVVKWMRFCWSVSYWGSPVLLTVLYRRGYFSTEGALHLGSYVVTLGTVLVFAVVIRAIGRYANPDYTKFLQVLRIARKNYTPENKKRLEQFDFEFWAWPVDFRVPRGQTPSSPAVGPVEELAAAKGIKGLLYRILSYVAAHTFGVRMVYPGKTSLIKALVGPALAQGRMKLVEEKKGVRAKLEADNGNHVDTMFVDRRTSLMHANGDQLVVCCEGNSGFYEIGCTITPLEAGYSVLGWNHPGFGGSTGIPFPSQEQSAIDAVMQYATGSLGFTPQNITLFAWSIGGYTASWAAMTYPEVKQVVLDATFDDILPLAEGRMPVNLRDVVHIAIRKYLNLVISEHMCRYSGPFLLIRRSRDEMITTQDPTVIASNRGNDLAIAVLKHRYPGVMNEDTLPTIRSYLSKTGTEKVLLYSALAIEEQYCKSLLKSQQDKQGAGFPQKIEVADPDERKNLALYLVEQHLRDYDSSHCTPLPHTFFTKPWSL